MIWRKKLATLVLAIALPTAASAQQRIVNGGFESGIASWGQSDQSGGSGSYYLLNGTTGPVSGLTLPGPHSGAWYVSSDQTGPGSHTLYQSFTISGAASSASLSFWHFIANYGGGPYGAQDDFDYNSSPNQRVQVDLLWGDISGNPFGGTVLANFFTGATNFGWTQYTQDITSLLSSAGTYSLRFTEVDNQSFFNHGIDNVSVNVSTVPEPGTIALVGFGMAALVGFKRRRRA